MENCLSVTTPVVNKWEKMRDLPRPCTAARSGVAFKNAGGDAAAVGCVQEAAGILFSAMLSVGPSC